MEMSNAHSWVYGLKHKRIKQLLYSLCKASCSNINVCVRSTHDRLIAMHHIKSAATLCQECDVGD